MKFIMRNIHTILFLVGISFIDISAFLYHEILGYLVLGISLVVISKLIDSD
ncbi:hypothetical protein [Vagococcus fessus]|uniref:hypothetical protein n=1 Tax=Vagococcus fessus TaxID=120370 RepID=UPI001475BE52|nr:hypothetical protein [Vagococcus fessus]